VVDPNSQAVVVPETAVTQFAGVEKVWRVVDGEAKEVTVRTGGRRDGQIVLLSGIEPGDAIITDGSLGRPGKVRIDAAPPAPDESSSALSSVE